MADHAPADAGRDRSPVAVLRAASDVAWRALVVVAAVIALGFAVGRLRLVVLPVVVALLLTAILAPVADWLRNRGMPSLLAAWVAVLGFLGLVVMAGFVIVPAVIDEFANLGLTLSKGVDDVERWLIEGPAELEPDQIERYREQARDSIADFLGSEQAVAGAVAVFEALAGAILALVLTFFFVKDGRRFQRWALSVVPARREALVAALGRSAWHALAGYLRGAAFIGLLEGAVLGLTLWLTGAGLAVPVAILTFFAAFFPIAGAVVAGIVAVLVALVSGGFGDAILVAIVALVVQQFDNDLLAPLIYGRAIRLHPAVVLIALTTGGTVAGIMGAFLAVPVAAVGVAVLRVLWSSYGDEWRGPDGGDAAAEPAPTLDPAPAAEPDPSPTPQPAPTGDPAPAAEPAPTTEPG
jgi:predicted PurR-regulated permease PerM